MSLEKLIALSRCDRLPPSLRDWLEQGVSTYLAAGGETLDACLGLSRNEPQLAKGRRDRHLRQAAKCLKANKPWTLAEQLVAEMRKFECQIWPSWKLRLSPPELASELRKHLFYARRHKRFPRSAKQVHRILTRFPAMSENSTYNNS